MYSWFTYQKWVITFHSCVRLHSSSTILWANTGDCSISTSPDIQLPQWPRGPPATGFSSWGSSLQEHQFHDMYSSYNDLLVAMDPSASRPETSQLGNCDRIRLSSGGRRCEPWIWPTCWCNQEKIKKTLFEHNKKGELVKWGPIETALHLV